ncbi:sigma factor [Clavibacter tessellarius]|uniref:sigma factor n=1 Tax=Clavibacter tessellarius TaxID=31965 RepID=UPI003247F1C7
MRRARPSAAASTTRSCSTTSSLADQLARQHSGRAHDWSDLRQVGYLGLVKAARRYDPGFGAPFVSFAIPTISGEIKRHLRDNGWVVRPPRQVQELRHALVAVVPALAQRLGRTPTDAEPRRAHRALPRGDRRGAGRALEPPARVPRLHGARGGGHVARRDPRRRGPRLRPRRAQRAARRRARGAQRARPADPAPPLRRRVQPERDRRGGSA